MAFAVVRKFLSKNILSLVWQYWVAVEANGFFRQLKFFSSCSKFPECSFSKCHFDRKMALTEATLRKLGKEKNY